jgi:hypothetical protein
MLHGQHPELPSDLKIGKHTVGEWQQMIDTTWGEGMATADKLILFDRCWEAVDKFYPGFVNLDLDWDSVRNHYRPEIEAGVSRGRLAGIFGQLSLALMEPHSGFADHLFLAYDFHADMPVFINRHNRLNRSPGFADDGWFGATITPVSEDVLIVLKCIPEHPLGLQPGDQVVGYDRIPWKDLYPLLMRLELPMQAGYQAGTEEAFQHNLLSSAGLNWHLFDTIDIKKAGADDTLHLPTLLLDTEMQSLFANEQLPVDGVPFPGDLDRSGTSEDLPNVLSGTIANTNIAYLYTLTTHGEDNASNVAKALDALIHEDTEGLILDLRWNTGGRFGWEKGFNRIFNRTLDSSALYARVPGGDHHELKWVKDEFEVLSEEFLNKPVAMLTGPRAMSNGDYMGYFIHEQPMSRSFGKRSSAGWIQFSLKGVNTPSCLSNVNLFNNQYLFWDMGYPEYLAYIAPLNYGRYIDGELVHFLHHCYDMDEDLWFTQEAAVNQTDNMVERAIEWIQNVAYADSCEIFETPDQPGDGSVTISSHLINPAGHEAEMLAKVYSDDGRFMEEVTMQEMEGRWQATYIPGGEESFYVEISTKDLDEASVLTYPGKLKLTSTSSRQRQGKLIPELKLYPNPANEYCLINLNGEAGITKIELCDLSGRIIFTIDQNLSDTYVLDCSGFNSGIYIVRVHSENIYTKKVVIR